MFFHKPFAIAGVIVGLSCFLASNNVLAAPDASPVPFGQYGPNGPAWQPAGTGPYMQPSGQYMQQPGTYMPEPRPYMPQAGTYMQPFGHYMPQPGPYRQQAAPYMPQTGPYMSQSGPYMQQPGTYMLQPNGGYPPYTYNPYSVPYNNHPSAPSQNSQLRDEALSDSIESQTKGIEIGNPSLIFDVSKGKSKSKEIKASGGLFSALSPRLIFDMGGNSVV